MQVTYFCYTFNIIQGYFCIWYLLSKKGGMWCEEALLLYFLYNDMMGLLWLSISVKKSENDE